MAAGEPIETERLVLRDWRPADLEPFARMNADPRVAEFLPAPLSREESDAMAGRIRAHFERHGFGLWVVAVPGTTDFAGCVGLSVPRFESWFTPCVEVAWRLLPAFWGRGYATEGARAAIGHGFETIGLAGIVSFTVPQNVRSVRVMERVGMRRDGDFEHPGLPSGHPLRRHVLYRIGRVEHGRQAARTTPVAPRTIGPE